MGFFDKISDIGTDIKNKIQNQVEQAQEKQQQEKISRDKWKSDSDKFEKLYSNRYVNLHYKYNETIDRLYKIGNSFDYKFNPKMEECIACCIKDIDIFQDFKRIHEECDQSIPTYPSFRRLAIIYDKRKEYDKAIAVCTQALLMGYDDEGSMYARLSKLLKKSGGMPMEEYLPSIGIMP